MVHVDESEIPIEEEKDKEMEREGSLGQLGEGKVAAFIAQGRVILASNVFPPLAPRLLPVTLTQHLFSIALKSRQFCLLCSVSPQKGGGGGGGEYNPLVVLFDPLDGYLRSGASVRIRIWGLYVDGG